MKLFNKNGKVTHLYWESHRSNFGDLLNPIIISAYSSKPVKKISSLFSRIQEHYFSIGSILQKCTRHTIVWGSGFISDNSICKQIPKNILAVRGPLTREKLLSQGINCPETYGDPALLLPEIYRPRQSIRKYGLGIIPHYKDKSNPWLKKVDPEDPEVKIIDVQNRDPLLVVDEITRCEKIASSSLHGLIVSDAYDIPSVWIEFSDAVIGKGFKFRDYYASVGKDKTAPFRISGNCSAEDIARQCDNISLKININRLKDVCPFN